MAAISFPRAIQDTLLIAALTFQPEAMQELTPTRGGDTLAADLGPELWRAHYESGLLNPTDFASNIAWAHTLLTSDKFNAYDPMFDYPLNYRNGWGAMTVGSPAVAFDGTCKIQSLNADNKRLTLYNLPAGFVFSVGDLLSFPYGSNGQQALHRVVQAVTASAGGVATNLEVRPFIRTGAAADNVVTLYRPSCLMNIVPGSYSERRVSRDIGGYLSFDAIQVSP